MEWEEVMTLRQAIPPRYPRGDPQNKLRIGPERRFNQALKQYETEHRVSWSGQEGRDYNPPR